LRSQAAAGDLASVSGGLAPVPDAAGWRAGKHMNPFDILVVIILGFCLIRGIFRGLIKEVASIVGVLAGFYAAYTYYRQLAAFLARWMDNPVSLNLVAFFVLFCGVFLTISILGVVVKYLLSIAFLGWVDRICGAGFGMIKGILISAVVLLTLTAFLPRGAPLLEKSLMAPHVTSLSETLARVVSRDMKKQFIGKIQEVKKAWKTHP
jgi:membrane protein required for colicin V production